MDRLLMCKPLHFGIEYEINPWMSKARQADRQRAVRQWEEIHGILCSLPDVQVALLEPGEGLPDLVFAANAGVVHGHAFIRSNFRYRERAREEPLWEGWFAAHGYRIITLPQATKFEGEGDLFVVGDIAYAGWGFRSHHSSHAAVRDALGMPVASLKLVDPYFYHLDTCFAPLGGGRVMYYPGAFAPESRASIEKHFPDRIVVPTEEARRFVCNAIVVGDTAITTADCPASEAALRAWGYQVRAVDTSEFIKSGGSAKCMALFLERDAAFAQGIVTAKGAEGIRRRKAS